MGKIIIVIESSQIQSASLREAAHQLLPTADDFRSALLDLYGFSPAKLEITIESTDELAEED